MALLTVLGLGALSFAIGAVTTRKWGGTVKRSETVKAYIVLIYMILPMMSSMAISAYNCDEVRGWGARTRTVWGEDQSHAPAQQK